MATTTTETLNGQVMDMLRQMDERLRRLEEQVAAVTKPETPQQSEEPWWKEMIGAFAGSEVYRSVVRRIQRNRREDYAKAAAEMDRAEKRDRRKTKRSKAGR